MEREIDLNEISDGRLYTAGDLVRVGCRDCEGCSACCRGMGDTIVLDPYDMWQLARGTGKDFRALLAEGRIALHAADGIVLPDLRMARLLPAAEDAGEGSCTFLDENGRCSIHAFRPGFCRLFPLGRIYEDRSFRYFLQVHECRKPDRTKVKVKKWLGIPELGAYERFIADWHFYLKDIQAGAARTEDEALRKERAMEVLERFYLTPWDGERDFYEQFYERWKKNLT